MKKIVVFLFANILFTITLIFASDISQGIIYGINICGKSLIPAVFPTMFTSLFCLYTIMPRIKNKTVKNIFLIFIAMYGGYPTGAKILGELHEYDGIKNSDAQKYIYLLINAGPGFIISFIGENLFSNVTIGIILFSSQIITSLIFICFSRPFCKITFYQTTSLTDSFLLSVKNATSSVISICAIVILLSGYSKIIHLLFNNLPLSYIGFIEITNGIINCKNILFASALLSFGGICVHLQIIKSAENITINYIKFIFIRLLHSLIAVILTYIQLKIFKINISVANINYGIACDNTISCIMLFITMIILLVTLSEKKVEIMK